VRQPADELRSYGNVEERWRADRLDPVVLAHLRATTSG
jgi:hypothetical protein